MGTGRERWVVWGADGALSDVVRRLMYSNGQQGTSGLQSSSDEGPRRLGRSESERRRGGWLIVKKKVSCGSTRQSRRRRWIAREKEQQVNFTARPFISPALDPSPRAETSTPSDLERTICGGR